MAEGHIRCRNGMNGRTGIGIETGVAKYAGSGGVGGGDGDEMRVCCGQREWQKREEKKKQIPREIGEG